MSKTTKFENFTMKMVILKIQNVNKKYNSTSMVLKQHCFENKYLYF